MPDLEVAAEIKILVGAAAGTSIGAHPGQTLAFGRIGCPISLAGLRTVSGEHGLVHAAPHFVAVTRHLDKGPVWLERYGQAPVLIEEGDTAIVGGSAVVRLRLANIYDNPASSGSGLFGDQAFKIIARTASTASPRRRGPRVSDVTELAQVGLRQMPGLDVLVAFCEPLLDDEHHGADTPLPSHAQIADRLVEAGQQRRAPGTIRNILGDWRRRLDLKERTDGSRCSCSLAVAAIQSGLVTRADLALLRDNS